MTQFYCMVLEPRCDLDEFTCIDGSCISHSRVCDGRPNCVQGEDEGDFCPTYAPVPPPRICAADQFVCTDGSCIPKEFVCDGVWQCEDG